MGCRDRLTVQLRPECDRGDRERQVHDHDREHVGHQVREEDARGRSAEHSRRVHELLLAQGFSVRCLLRPERAAEVFSGRSVEVARGDLRSQTIARTGTQSDCWTCSRKLLTTIRAEPLALIARGSATPTKKPNAKTRNTLDAVNRMM